MAEADRRRLRRLRVRGEEVEAVHGDPVGDEGPATAMR